MCLYFYLYFYRQKLLRWPEILFLYFIIPFNRDNGSHQRSAYSYCIWGSFHVGVTSLQYVSRFSVPRLLKNNLSPLETETIEKKVLYILPSVWVVGGTLVFLLFIPGPHSDLQQNISCTEMQLGTFIHKRRFFLPSFLILIGMISIKHTFYNVRSCLWFSFKKW